MHNDKDSKDKTESRSFLGKIAELVNPEGHQTESDKPQQDTKENNNPTTPKFQQYMEQYLQTNPDKVDSKHTPPNSSQPTDSDAHSDTPDHSSIPPSQDANTKNAKTEHSSDGTGFIEQAMGQLNSVASQDRNEKKSHRNPIKTIEQTLNELESKNTSYDTLTLLESTNLSSDQFQQLLLDIRARVTRELESTKIDQAVEQWHDLYENFRIGLQLGFRYFTDAIISSGDDIPDQEEIGSPWSWHTWETMVGNLLNNFDQYCAKDISGYIKKPGKLIEESLIIDKLASYIETAPAKPSTQIKPSKTPAEIVEETFLYTEAFIISKVSELHSQLEMNNNLEDIIHTPGTIANDFETYLWANYITKQKIGGYGHSLRDRLLGAPRRAPNGQVTARLKYLKVAEADELDKITGQRAANGKLKRLNDWARENVCEFNTWEKICYDSTRFLPRSSS